MWARTRPYVIRELELSRPAPAIEIPEGYGGLAVTVRLDDRPVGYWIEPASAGERFSPEEVSARILKEAGKEILRDKIYRELRARSPREIPFPTLDIAVCTHNRPDRLARCLASLKSHGALGADPGVGVLVVDNAPPDDRTERTVRESFPGVRYCVEPKPGLDFARNRAVAESEATLLAFLDDDVVIDRRWLDGLRDAWAANPDAAAFTGPILPFQLETRAQIAFERMGGFGHVFNRERFGPESVHSPTYPCGAGMFGAGANMAFRRSTLVEMGGFDDALDTGAPLPGGGDLDIFYRIVRSGRVLVREPGFVVYHEHRREYAKVRRQMWTWGLGSMAFITKSWRHDPSQRPKMARWLLWWLSYQLSKFVPFLRRNRKPWPLDLVVAEIAGGAAGLCGAYDRSLARTERLRRQHA